MAQTSQFIFINACTKLIHDWTR